MLVRCQLPQCRSGGGAQLDRFRSHNLPSRVAGVSHRVASMRVLGFGADHRVGGMSQHPSGYNASGVVVVTVIAVAVVDD